MSKIKKIYSIPVSVASCHTAIIKEYIIEGHVPASDIKKLIKDMPDILGLAVPGMPIGSPGMERGDKKVPYKVYAILRDGSVRVYNSY
jgi:hypothetical protein